MRKQYDFSDAVKGKFYTPKEKANMPIYLDEKNRKFYFKKAEELGVNPTILINKLLRKDMELLQEMQ